MPATRAFVAAVKAGNLARAKALYAPARTHYESIEPVAESFGDLDPQIDARVNDVADASQWTGFHRIEKALWADKSLTGMAPYGDLLLADVTKLQRLVPTAKLQPAAIANGAVELLGEVANSKITGEEDRYSHTDLWDFEANIAGVREALDVLAPALRQRDPAVLSTAQRPAGHGAHAPCRRTRRPSGYVSYATVPAPERRTMTHPGQRAGRDAEQGRAGDRMTGRRPQLTRRGFLGGSALVGAAAAGAAGGVLAMRERPRSARTRRPAPARVPFFGSHQAGIATPAQDRLAFAAFDLTTTSRADLQDLLREWSLAAHAMCAGSAVPGRSTDPAAPPADTGEAHGLPAAQLTITAGLGPSVFDHRFGLSARRPAALADIPALPRDDLDPARSNGDLGIQACSNDPQVAFHAIRNLARIGRDVVSMRWSQLGFGRTSSTSTSQATPRNLMGFKDGTRNVKAEDASDMDGYVWVGAEGDQPWMRGGSYVVTRRIRMRIEGWDRDYLQDQESVIGRAKVSGAPLGGAREFDPPDFHATGRRRDAGDPRPTPTSGWPATEQNGGLRILRRGYSFTDGTDPATGELDAGLFFICYQKDPRRQFVPLQRRLGAHDALNEYIEHTSSAVFACPPGVRRAGDYWARGLFT